MNTRRETKSSGMAISQGQDGGGGSGGAQKTPKCATHRVIAGRDLWFHLAKAWRCPFYTRFMHTAKRVMLYHCRTKTSLSTHGSMLSSFRQLLRIVEQVDQATGGPRLRGRLQYISDNHRRIQHVNLPSLRRKSRLCSSAPSVPPTGSQRLPACSSSAFV